MAHCDAGAMDGGVHLITHISQQRSIIGNGSHLTQTVVMGADQYQSKWREENPGSPPFGIGRGCRIHRAIIDKNAHIGDGVVINPEDKPAHHDGENFYIRDGIVVIPKNAVVPAGTII